MNENYKEYIEQISHLELEDFSAGFLQALGFYCLELSEIKAKTFYQGETE